MTFFVPGETNDNLAKSIEFVISHINLIPENESQRAQDLILTINRCNKNSDPVSQEKMAELQKFESYLRNIMREDNAINN